MSKETGGFAFGEFERCGDLAVKTGGLTVRDYFAAKAMAAMIPAFYEDKMHDNANIEKAAYQIADAMLAERAK